MDKNSSKPSPNRVLAERLDRFLLEFVNVDESRRLSDQFPDLLPLGIESDHEFSHLLHHSPEQNREQNLRDYRELMREMWVARHDGQRRYFAFQLRSRLYRGLEAIARANIPKTIERRAKGDWRRVSEWKSEYSDKIRTLWQTPFEEALDRLEKLAGHTKVCGNPECPARYFIAQRRSQRYCSEACAGLFQRQAKRNWWEMHGREWREQQNQKRQRRGDRVKTKRK